MNVRARFTFVLALSLFPQVPGLMPYHRSYVHMAYALCTNGSFRYKMHMPCVPRPPHSTKEIVRARTISLARLRSGKWWLGGATCHYHNTRALQAQPTHARSSHLAWKDSWDILNSHTHVSFPTVSFCPATLVPRRSERYSGLHQPHNFASPSRV